MMEMLQHMQTTLARHEDEIKESIWLSTAKEAMQQAAAVARKVDQLALDMNGVREKSYEASILALGGGVSGTGGASATDAASALKLLKSEMEGVRVVTRRIELHQCTDALTFHHLRELQRGGKRTRGRVEELEHQMVLMKAEHARELRAVRALAEQALSGGKRGRRGVAVDEGGDGGEGEDEEDSKYGHYQGKARQRRSQRRRRAEEGYDSDPEQLDAELEELAVGLDKQSTR